MDTTSVVSRRSLVYDRNLQIIFLVTIMTVLGVSSLTPALPGIAREMKIPKSSIGLLIMMFTLPGVILTPVLGVTADRFGRKTVLVPALLLFAVAGAACYWAPDYHILLLFRFLQGSGAAALGALNVTLIGDLFDGKDRTTAMGYNASVLSVSTAALPFVGGLFGGIEWWLPFLLPLLAVPIAFAVLVRLDVPYYRPTEKLASYLHSSARSLLDRRAVIYFGCGLLLFLLLYGPYLTYTPILLAENFGAVPLKIGIFLSIMSATNALVASQTGRLSRRFSEKRLLNFSFALYAAALLILPIMANAHLMILPIMLYGIAQGLSMPSLQTLIAGLAPFEYRAAFMSINGMILRIGQTLGPLLAGSAYAAGGMKLPFWLGAGCSAAMFFLLGFFTAGKAVNE